MASYVDNSFRQAVMKNPAERSPQVGGPFSGRAWRRAGGPLEDEGVGARVCSWGAEGRGEGVQVSSRCPVWGTRVGFRRGGSRC